MQSRTGPYAFVCGAAGGRNSQRRGAAVCATSKAVGEAPLTVHASDDTSIQVLYPVAHGNALIGAVNELIISFQKIKEASESGKRVKEQSLDYCLVHENLRFEVQCNPNMYPELVHAKVYIKADDGRVCTTTTALLPKLVESLKTFKAQHEL